MFISLGFRVYIIDEVPVHELGVVDCEVQVAKIGALHRCYDKLAEHRENIGWKLDKTVRVKKSGAHYCTPKMAAMRGVMMSATCVHKQQP